VDRRRLLALLVLVVGLSVFAVYLGLVAALVVTGGSDAADYTAFYTGWTIVLEGRGADLYDPAVQAEVQRQVLGGRSFEAGLNPFNNPPHLVLPFVPLALLPLTASYVTWAVVQIGLLLWLLRRLLTTVAAEWSREERSLLVAASVALPSLALTLWQGAFSLLVTVAVFELYLALVAGRDRASGVWAVIGSLKPQAVAGFGVMLIAARRWQAVAGALVVGGGLVLAATLVLGIGIWTSYLGFLREYVASFDTFSVRPSVMWNVRGTLAIWFGPEIDAQEAALINGIALAVQVLGLVAIAALWIRRWEPATDAFRLRFAATILIGILTSAHLNPHDGLLLIPAAVLAYGALRTTRSGPALGVGLAAAPFLILVLNPLSVNEPGGPPVRVPVALCVILLGVVLAALRVARPSQLTSQPSPTR